MSQCCCGEKVRDEKLEKLQEVFKKYKNKKGALIPVLQEAQDIYGYLPEEVLKKIALELKVPLSKVYGVVTFYAQFHLKPRGRNIIRVCLGTACHVRGGAKIFEKLQEELQVEDGETTEDLKFTLESVACIGACGLAPVIMVNDDTHGRLTPDRIPEILAQYK
ncbi:MAG: NADH-quinone oxidoreductase subunit [Clostridia bacterium]|jgi:NADH-quinone oxidoreductase subunit E|nr:NADH-quinone oxidoreductase subunit [Clostridiales bacterium]MDK2984795.1 NADH-quinone oxidoreductase subunit [Clostridia bacterium]